jgi:type I restriction enzyme M protein
VTTTPAATTQQPSSKQNLSAFIWSVADLLRGDYKKSDYGKVILPFTVLRQLDCVLEPTKAAVLEEKALREGQGLDREPFLLRKTGHNFCNTSPLDMKRLMGDGDNIAENLRSYIQAFSPAVRDIFDSFEFHLRVDRLDKAVRFADENGNSGSRPHTQPRWKPSVLRCLKRAAFLSPALATPCLTQ